MAKAKKVKVKVEPKAFDGFRHHRILHGGKQVCDLLAAYKKVYKLVHWDLEPVGNQYLLVVELEEK